MKALYLIFAFLFCIFSSHLYAESTPPNKYELAIIEDNVRSSFQTLMQIWKEELYFEMYDFGQQTTKKVLKKADFVQRMVDLKWKPAIEEDKIQKIHVIYRNFGAVHAIIKFQNKVNAAYTIKKLIVFPVTMEKNTWKYDLTQLIRIPYIGKIPPEKPAPKKDSKSPKEATAEQAAAPEEQQQ